MKCNGCRRRRGPSGCLFHLRGEAGSQPREAPSQPTLQKIGSGARKREEEEEAEKEEKEEGKE